MAKIEQYTSSAQGLQPSEIGVESAAGAGRRAGAFFNQKAATAESVGNAFAANLRSSIEDVGETIRQHMAHQEVSSGAAGAFTLHEGLSNAWNERVKNADPNDTTVAAKFQEEVLEPALAKYSDGFNTDIGQKFAEAQIEHLRTHLGQKAAADMSTLAKTAVAANVHTIETRATNTAMADPSAVPSLLAGVDSAVGGIVESSPNLKGADAAGARITLTSKIKDQIVKAGAFSAIQSSPNPEATAAAWAAKYPDYINGMEARTLAKAATAQVKFNNAQDRAGALAQKQLEKLTADRAGASIVSDLINDDGTVRTATPADFKKLKDVSKLPGADRGEVTSMFKFLQTEAKDRSVSTDPQAMQGALDLMLTDPHGAKMAAVKAVNDQKLNDKDFARVERTIKFLENRSPDEKDMLTGHLAAVTAKLRPKGGLFQSIDPAVDAAGARAVADYKRWFYPWYSQQIGSGRKPADVMKEALEPANVEKFTSPSSGTNSIIDLLRPPEEPAKRKPLSEIFGAGGGGARG